MKKELTIYALKLLFLIAIVVFASRAFTWFAWASCSNTLLLPSDAWYSDYMEQSTIRIEKQMQRDAECDYFGIPRGIKCEIAYRNTILSFYGRY